MTILKETSVTKFLLILEVEGDYHLHTYCPGDPMSHRRPVRDPVGLVVRDSSGNTQGQEHPGDLLTKGSYRKEVEFWWYWNQVEN